MKKTQPVSQPPSPGKRQIPDYGRYPSFSPGNGAGGGKRRRRQRQFAFRLAALLLVGLMIGGLAWSALASGNRPIQESSGSQTTGSTAMTGNSSQSASVPESASATPTPAATTTANEPTRTLSQAERQARLDETAAAVIALLDNHPEGRFAVYFQNLTGGETWAFQADQPFVAASSIKLGINTYLYTKIADGSLSPDEWLAYDSRAYPTGDYEAGTGTIQGLPDGSKLTVRETSGLSIRISDNCGTNMIIRRLGGIDAINPWLNQISGKVDYRRPVSYVNYGGQSQSGRHRTCALDLGLQAVNLYHLWQADPAHYQPLIDDLCQTEFDFGIQKGIPSDIRVAHKIGTNGAYSAENDVGLVFTSEPFALCVMTEMASAATAHQIQADIARLFYDLAAPVS